MEIFYCSEYSASAGIASPFTTSHSFSIILYTITSCLYHIPVHIYLPDPKVFEKIIPAHYISRFLVNIIPVHYISKCLVNRTAYEFRLGLDQVRTSTRTRRKNYNYKSLLASVILLSAHNTRDF